MGIFDLIVFKVLLRSFGALVSKLTRKLKTASGRMRQSKMSYAGSPYPCFGGTFDLVVYKDMLGSLGAQIGNNSKMAGRRPKRI